MDIGQYSNLLKRINELEKSIIAINSYDRFLRVKYYPVLKYSIKLLIQYKKEINKMEREVI